MTPQELSVDLRDSDGGYLCNRRWIACLSLFGIACMGAVTLFQTGVIEHVPQLPLPGADADRVHGSGQAYSILETPDGALAIGSYAATLGLASMGPSDRSRTMPWVPFTLAAKAFTDAALAMKYALDQPRKYRRFSILSILALLSTISAAALAYPEAADGWRRMTVDGHDTLTDSVKGNS